MVTNNKVLTVSYGTFSCTLEGFDDSFDTMKAIAEYFRDLASDDRYFGAEPPTPDAEMLTRIAEREIERRVNARHEDGAIVLSAATPAVADPAPAAAPAPATAPAVEDKEDAHIAEANSEEMQVVEPVDALVDQAMASDALVTDTAETIVSEDVVDVSTEPVEEIIEEEMQIVDAEIEDTAENLFEEAFEADEADVVETATTLSDEEDSIAAKLRRIRAVVSRSETEADDDDFMEDQHAEDEAVAPTQDFDDLDEVEADDEDDFIEASEEELAPAPVEPVRARVIRMKRTEFEDAIASGALEEAEEEAPAEAPSSLSADEEADLMAELADLDAELDIEPTVDETPVQEDVFVEEEAPVESRRERRKRRAQLEQEPPQEEAVDRLIEEANTKLDEPEGNRRRNAIAHLRAAVAATKAEKDAGKSLVKEDNEDIYRDDLASAMRPQSKDADAPRKSAAPLKLVAAQRIDAEEDTAPKQGIRPRRVSPEDIAAVEANAESSDFVEFAENMGATQLPEVLEAAASYLTFVEGRRKFSRPMLMRLAYQVGEQRFEREAGLRSFGQLLRENKIEKIAGGRFTVSDSISFKPGDRAAG